MLTRIVVRCWREVVAAINPAAGRTLGTNAVAAVANATNNSTMGRYDTILVIVRFVDPPEIVGLTGCRSRGGYGCAVCKTGKLVDW